MSIVVTGAAGFLGSSLVPALIHAGHDVVAIDRRTPPSPHTTTHRSTATTGVATITTEITERRTELTDALRHADAVIHLAGCPGVRDRGPGVAQRRHRDNVEATSVVLEATPAGTPVIALSSSSVYGGTAGRPSREGDLVHPRGGYAVSKVAAERRCQGRASRGGHVLVVRPFTVLGEHQRPDMAVSRWLAEALAGRALTVLGSMERTRDVTDVRQVAAALIALLDNEATGTVNLGTGQGHTLDQVARAVCAAVGAKARYDVVPADAAEVGHTLADTTVLQSLLGWVPRTDLRQVVARAVASLCIEHSSTSSTTINAATNDSAMDGVA